MSPFCFRCHYSCFPKSCIKIWSGTLQREYYQSLNEQTHFKASPMSDSRLFRRRGGGGSHQSDAGNKLEKRRQWTSNKEYVWVVCFELCKASYGAAWLFIFSTFFQQKLEGTIEFHWCVHPYAKRQPSMCGMERTYWTAETRASIPILGSFPVLVFYFCTMEIPLRCTSVAFFLPFLSSKQDFAFMICVSPELFPYCSSLFTECRMILLFLNYNLETF